MPGPFVKHRVCPAPHNIVETFRWNASSAMDCLMELKLLARTRRSSGDDPASRIYGAVCGLGAISDPVEKIGVPSERRIRNGSLGNGLVGRLCEGVAGGAHGVRCGEDRACPV